MVASSHRELLYLATLKDPFWNLEGLEEVGGGTPSAGTSKVF